MTDTRDKDQYTPRLRVVRGSSAPEQPASRKRTRSRSNGTNPEQVPCDLETKEIISKFANESGKTMVDIVAMLVEAYGLEAEYLKLREENTKKERQAFEERVKLRKKIKP